MTTKLVVILLFFCFSVFLPSVAVAAAQTATVTASSDGFLPRQTTVEAGAIVTFVNKDTVPRWPASNLHPTHYIYPEFDPKGPVPPGQSWQFKAEKVGIWKYHDHLLPHQKGTLTVVGQEKQSITAKIAQLARQLIQTLFGFLPINKARGLEQSEQTKILENITLAQGPETAWKYLTDSQGKTNQQGAHDLAHFFGSLLYKKYGFEKLNICTPVFAFGCHHGFSEAALEENLDNLEQMTQACQGSGATGTGPWASCIHGIGHGVATYFQNTDLTASLATCDKMSAGAAYCHDGVFMEFVANAPKSVYQKTATDPLYPCTTVEDKYKIACARQQPQVMSKHLGFGFEQIFAVCSASPDKTIRYYCIDALGLGVGQESAGNAETIVARCGLIKNLADRAQCVSAAAAEIVFQDYPGWRQASTAACASLPAALAQLCNGRVAQTAQEYARGQ